MSVQQFPAPARSDVPRSTGSRGRSGSTPTRPYFRHGTMLTVGAAAWAASMVYVGGPDPSDYSTAELLAFCFGSGLFQVGLLALLRALYRSQALGTGRAARTFLKIESVLVGLAIASTLVDGFGISDLSQPGWLILDLFWPISMMGMFAIGVRIAIAGRWTGVARFWPMVAESWALVVIPTLNIFGTRAAGVVAVVHLLVGYAVLGQVVARKSD